MKQPSSSSGQRSTRPHQCYYFSCPMPLLCFVLLVAVLYGEDLFCILTQLHGQEQKEEVKLGFVVGETAKGCNIFAGRWVYDEASRPHYAEPECPYIHPQLTCQQQGRPEKTYQHWRWQPHGCSLPSFNASLMLEKLRGKRMLFVGDSLNRGQFVSMVCLLHRGIAGEDKSMTTSGSLTVFRAKEYNATVEFYWAPFLAESNSDDAIVHRVKDRVVRVGSLEKHSRQWRRADVIVFNTYVWWMTGRMMNTIAGPLSSGMPIKEMETEEVYRATMRSMVRWVEETMDPQKTRVFFVTMSPAHEKSKEWGGEAHGNCYNETSPIEDPNYWGSFSNKTIMRALGEELRRSKVPIVVVNITQLSEYRKDAHTSVYKKQWNPLTPEQRADPRSYADCVHWCLPGLQDAWNELLYTKLFFP